MSKVICTEVSDDLLNEIDGHREGEPPEYDESRSAVIRRLIRDGIEYQETNRYQSIATGLIISGMIGIIFALSGELGPIPSVLMVPLALSGVILDQYGHRLTYR